MVHPRNALATLLDQFKRDRHVTPEQWDAMVRRQVRRIYPEISEEMLPSYTEKLKRYLNEPVLSWKDFCHALEALGMEGITLGVTDHVHHRTMTVRINSAWK